MVCFTYPVILMGITMFVCEDWEGYCNTWVLYFTIHRVDPFTKKEWYDVKAPIMFTNRNVGKTVVSKTQGKSMQYLDASLLHF